jgi:cell division protein ZapE
MTDLLEAYHQRIKTGALQPDAGQIAVAERLNDLSRRLVPRRHIFARSPFVRGLYIHGPVGRGKSMLMDLFFDAAPVAAKRRVHFNAFMLDIHRSLHEARGGEGDPLPRVASSIATATRLLCFDEFQVNDIADAMILARLFTALLDRGVVVVATSNVAPDDLYKGGLQRALFLPFIDLLKDRLDIVAIGPGIDHRLARLAGRQVWFWPDDAAATAALDALFALAAGDHVPASIMLDVDGRALSVPLAAGRVARFGFDDLCRRDVGAADYLALAAAFDAVLLDHVPVFAPAARNEALRFMALVDQFYEKRLVLAASSAAPCHDLYPPHGKPPGGDAIGLLYGFSVTPLSKVGNL